MAKTDRTILISNDQQFGQVADPNKLEAQITHAFDKIDANDTEFANYQAGRNISRSRIVAGAIGKDELDPNLWEQTASQSKFNEIDEKLTDNAKFFISATNPPTPLVGAKFDNVTDDTSAIQGIVNYLKTKGGGYILCPFGVSLISSKIIVNAPIYFIGQGKGGVTNNTNGSGIGSTTFRWISDTPDTMFEFVSETISNYLFGGGMSNLLLDGSAKATRGLNLRSCGYMDIKSIEGRSFIAELGLIDDSNGVLSQFNHFEDIHYVYGAGVTTQDSHGLVFYGSSGIGVTQNHIISITGLMNNGYVLVFKTSDNNIIEKCHGVVLGTGGAVWFANGNYADSNVINYLVGKVKSDSNAKGNVIKHWNSEGGGLTIDPLSVLHYELFDYNHCDYFTTNKYVMTDEKDLSVGQLQIIDGNAVNGVSSGQWACINLVDSADSKIGSVIPSVYGWADGVIKSIRIHFSEDTTNVAKTFRVTVNASTFPKNSAIVALEHTQIVLIPSIGNPYMNGYYEIPLNLPYTRGDSIFFAMQRNGVHADDTCIGNMQILGASLIYESTGANSEGSGAYPSIKPYKV